MGLIDLWYAARQQLEDKHVAQIIAIAGQGRLTDRGAASVELRELLRLVPSATLARYAEEALQGRFDDAGFALQDIVNEVGRRLGFRVEHGRYRGTPNAPGHDGLWRSPQGHAIIVEVKTSDSYRIELYRIEGYRRELIDQGVVVDGASSILLVVGRQATDDLEAQIRGSRYAWDMRLISVDALLRLVWLRESMDDPRIVAQIAAILIPREFTRLDEIVNVLFSTAEEVRPDDAYLDEDDAAEPVWDAEPWLDASSSPVSAAPVVAASADGGGGEGEAAPVVADEGSADGGDAGEALEAAPDAAPEAGVAGEGAEPEEEGEASPPVEVGVEGAEPEPVVEAAGEAAPAVVEVAAPSASLSTAPDPREPTDDPEALLLDVWPAFRRRFAPVALHLAVVAQVEHHLHRALIKRSKTGYLSPDQAVGAVALISRAHLRPERVEFYFALHPHQIEFLQSVEEGWLALGCGTDAYILLIPLEDIEPWLGAQVTRRDGRVYWRVRVHATAEAFSLHQGQDEPDIDMTPHLLPLWSWM